jgi:hypothetical protein
MGWGDPPKGGAPIHSMCEIQPPFLPLPRNRRLPRRSAGATHRRRNRGRLNRVTPPQGLSGWAAVPRWWGTRRHPRQRSALLMTPDRVPGQPSWQLELSDQTARPTSVASQLFLLFFEEIVTVVPRFSGSASGQPRFSDSRDFLSFGQPPLRGSIRRTFHNRSRTGSLIWSINWRDCSRWRCAVSAAARSATRRYPLVLLSVAVWPCVASSAGDCT